MKRTLEMILPRLEIRPAVDQFATAMNRTRDEVKRKYAAFWKNFVIEWGPGFGSLNEVLSLPHGDDVMPTTFTDALGREWALAPTVGHLRQLRELGFDLPGLFKETGSLGELLFADPEKLVQAFWLLVEPQADKLGVCSEQFAWGFDSSTLEVATVELIMSDFALLRGSKAAEQARPKILAALAKADEAVATAISTKLD